MIGRRLPCSWSRLSLRSAAPTLSGRAPARARAGCSRSPAASLAGYGVIATLQPDNNFGRVLAAYGGVFVAGSLAWGIAFDGFRPDRYDVLGALICLGGVGVMMYAPR